MWTLVDSPIGELRVVEHEGAVISIDFPPYRTGTGMPLGVREDGHPVLTRAAQQLGEYFAGEREVFELPLAPEGSTFQRRVWDALLGVGFGYTATYADIAHRLGMTAAAARAVGLANGRNPIAIVIPCHRIVGADGSLTGYSGGLERKQALLALESNSLF